MNARNLQPEVPREESPVGDSPLSDSSLKDASPTDPSPKDSPLVNELENTLQLGEHIVSFVTGVIDLARVEAMLAIKSLPKVIMLWFLMMPVLLLAWCSFSALVAWSIYEVSELIGLGMFVFFLQQLLLLLVCKWLYTKYQARMSLPNTRSHISEFMRTLNHGSPNTSKTQE